MNNLEKIYYNLEKLTDDIRDCDEVKNSTKKFFNYTDNLADNISGERIEEIRELVMEMCTNNEKQGFMFGFNYAKSILLEK